jgi:hypothetical protein
MWRRRKASEVNQVAENTRKILQMRSQLDGLLSGFALLGGKVESAAPDGVPDVPPGLIAATRRIAPRPGGEPVKVTVPDGREVIAVVAEDSDPVELMRAITRLAAGR